MFALGCAAIVLAAVFRRGWRASSVAAVDEPQPDSDNELVALDGIFEFDDWTEPPDREPAGDGDAQAKSA